MTKILQAYGTGKEPQIWSSVIRSLRMAMEELNIEVKSLLETSQISAYDLEHPHGQVPLNRYLQFLNNAAIQADDPLLGIKLPKTMGPDLLGGLGFLFLSSRNLHEGIKHICYYQNLFQESTNMQLIRDGDYFVFTYDLYGVRQIDTRLDVEFSIAYTNRLIKLYSDNKASNLRLCFRHSPSAELQKYRRLTGSSCFFNQEINGIYLHKSDALEPGSRYDLNLHQILVDYLDTDLANKQMVLSFADQVSRAILNLPSGKAINAGLIAAHLNMSVATLYRRLQQENTSFKQIYKKVQYELSCRYLREASLNIAQISHLLGFASSSGFTRAFTQWSHGLSPSQYRQLSKQTTDTHS